MFKGNTPEKGTEQWKKNEKIINQNGYLRKMRDKSEGIEKPNSSYSNNTGGKGSAQRPGDKKAYSDGWDRIWGNKDKNNE